MGSLPMTSMDITILLLSRIVLVVKRTRYGLVSTCKFLNIHLCRYFQHIYIREVGSCVGKCSQKSDLVYIFSFFVFVDECICCGGRWRRVTQISRRITWRGSLRGSHGGCGDPIRMLKENFSGQEKFCGPLKSQY